MANNLGERIKLARKKAGITQGELAAKLGIAYPTLNKYERGHRTPNASLLGKIVNILKCAPGWLLSGEGQETHSSGVKVSRTPVLNGIPDEFPEQVSEETCEYISLPDVPEEAYAIIIKGDSMSPAIRDGDYAIFIHDNNISIGDIIVLNTEWGESKIRRYQKRNNKVFYVSDNPEYPTITPKINIKLIGKIIAVWRRIRF